MKQALETEQEQQPKNEEITEAEERLDPSLSGDSPRRNLGEKASLVAGGDVSDAPLSASLPRPPENGLAGGSVFTLRTDVSRLTKADRADIAHRVAHGEHITFK